MLVKSNGNFIKKLDLQKRKKVVESLKHGLCPKCGSDMVAEQFTSDYCSNTECPFSDGNKFDIEYPWLRFYHRYK